MDAVEFIKQHIRICNAYDCDDCPLHGKCAINGGALLRDDKDIIASVATVEQWEKEHPRKTMLQDFLEKYPDAPLNINGDYPECCPFMLGYKKGDCIKPRGTCVECWNRPVE